MNHEEIIGFVDNWLLENMPQVRRWQYDDNCGERSILLFHVHVYIEVIPFSFNAKADLEYFPPHMNFVGDDTESSFSDSFSLFSEGEVESDRSRSDDDDIDDSFECER